MATVIDYQYSVPQAYTFPARPHHSHHSHSHARSASTASSNAAVAAAMLKHHPQPLNLTNPVHHGSHYLVPSPQYHSHNRTPSTATTASIPLARSPSATSSGHGNTYVTALRKQKATVWCDRAQREDARILAAQKAAKQRAAQEVALPTHHRGHSNSGASSSHRGKISHHGRGGKKAPNYHEFTTNRSLVADVPARLDIDDDNSDDDCAKTAGSGSGSVYNYTRTETGITRRTNSGKSSIHSANGGLRRLHTMPSNVSGGSGGPVGVAASPVIAPLQKSAAAGSIPGSPRLQLRIQDAQQFSGAGYNGTNHSSPSTYSRTSSLLDTAVPEVPEIVETPGTVIGDPARVSMNSPSGRPEYFYHHQHNRSNSRSNSIHHQRPIASPASATPSSYSPSYPQSQTLHQSDSFVSSSSSDSSRPNYSRTQSSREPQELRRKGSIDESRTMTMGRVRLFVANPDE